MKNYMPASSGQIAQRLSEINTASPELEDIIQIYSSILPLLRDADLLVAPIVITEDDVRQKLESGLPLLQDMAIEFDFSSMAGLMASLINSVGNKDGPVAASIIRVAMEEGRLNPLDVASLAVAGDKDKLMNYGRQQALDPELLWTLSQFALKPVYFAIRRQTSHLIENINWDRGACPICGALAVLGEMRDNNQAKYLRCGRCGAAWRTSRLQCHLCQNEDHRTLGILYNNEKPGNTRLEVCEKCKGYLKVIPTFSPFPPEMIAVEDLATLNLDYAAQRAGYNGSSSLVST